MQSYNDYNVKNDIALLRISGDVTLGRNVYPACLPEPGREFTGSNAVECYTTGWGNIGQ